MSYGVKTYRHLRIPPKNMILKSIIPHIALGAKHTFLMDSMNFTQYMTSFLLEIESNHRIQGFHFGNLEYLIIYYIKHFSMTTNIYFFKSRIGKITSISKHCCGRPYHLIFTLDGFPTLLSNLVL